MADLDLLLLLWARPSAIRGDKGLLSNLYSRYHLAEMSLRQSLEEVQLFVSEKRKSKRGLFCTQKITAYLQEPKPITGKSTWEEQRHLLKAVSKFSRWRGCLLGLRHVELSVCSKQLFCMSEALPGSHIFAAAASFPSDGPGGCSMASVFTISSSPVGLRHR